MHDLSVTVVLSKNHCNRREDEGQKVKRKRDDERGRMKMKERIPKEG